MKILKRPSEPSRDPNEILHVTRASIPWLLEVLARTKDVVSGDTETWKCEVGEEHPAGRARATCVTLATEDFPNIYVDNWREEEGNILRLKPWFEDAGKPKVFHNAKFDMHVLLNHGIELRGLAGDTLVMDYMIDTSREGRHDLETCLLDWFGEEHKNYSETFAWHPPKKNGEPQKKAVTRPHYEWWDMGEHFMVMNYACKDTREGRRLYFHHKRRLEQTPWTGGFNYWEFYQKYWLPMTTVLFRMERRGCQVDLEYTAELDEYLEEVSVEAFRRFYGALRGTGLPTSYIEQLNPGSGPQMAELLFDKLGFVPSKLTPSKKGYAVDAEVLQELATLPKGGFLLPLLESREVAKLRGTYTQRFLKDAPFDNGRIHTNLGQTATVTGRLSSSGPNLQNIPIRSELGKLLRNCFGARPGYLFLGGDLSQIELIIAAHLSQDRVMLQYIREGLDLHSYTAYSVVPWLRAEVDAKFGGVTKEALKWVKKDHGNLRDRAKTLNYAVQYGAGQKRAASIFGTSEEEGAEAISRYMNGYIGMSAFIDAQHKRARRDGHVRTVLKRYCHLPHANSASFGMRKRAERQSVNYSIQGGAGDIISLGMLLIEDNPRLKELGYEMTLQIHDEITGEAPADAAQECQGIIQELMSNPYEAFGLKPLSVPTPAAVGIGTTWGNAKV